MDSALMDRQQIRELSEQWVLYRDAGDWERFKSVWHAGATIDTLWYQGAWEGYLERSQAAWGRGMSSVHFLCGSLIEVAGNRGLCRSNTTMYGRGEMGGTEYDLEVIAQFCDLVEKRSDCWGLVYRCVVHIKDRIDPVDATATLPLDAALLARQPAHYRHLAYIHAKAGRVVKTDMPGIEGAAADRLRERCRSWLSGGSL